jgi:hypothetical protein
MEDLRTRAQLVSDPARAGAGAVGTVVTRAEIAEAAARNEFPATFLLDLDRVEAGDGGEVMAHASIAVDWDEQTLGQLLASTDGDEITLWFDEAELARAFDEDVEAHGFRQKVAVLAIAVTAAGASAAPSLAARAATGAGGGSGAIAATSSGGGSGAIAATSSGGGSGAIAATSSGGGSGVEAAPHTGSGSGAIDSGATGSGQGSLDLGATQGGGGSGAIDSGATGSGQGSLDLGATQGGGGSGGTAPAVTSQGGGTSDSELAAIAGAGALLISAAGFGVARKRTRPGQPA